MTVLTEKEQSYLETLKLMFNVAKHEVGIWQIKIDRTFSNGPVVLYHEQAQLVKTFSLDADPATVMGFALGFAAGTNFGRRKATMEKEAELRNLLGISVTDNGNLYVSNI